jgi:hypothetical protein
MTEPLIIIPPVKFWTFRTKGLSSLPGLYAVHPEAESRQGPYGDFGHITPAGVFVLCSKTRLAIPNGRNVTPVRDFLLEPHPRDFSFYTL